MTCYRLPVSWVGVVSTFKRSRFTSSYCWTELHLKMELLRQIIFASSVCEKIHG